MNTMPAKDHWENVYSTMATSDVSWFQPHADLSVRLIRSTEVNRRASIIDVGGGASTLVDDLLADGFDYLSVLDLSGAALNAARLRLGARAESVDWLEADITQVILPAHAFDVWHDRAVFHFLTTPEDRAAYVKNVVRAVKPGGHVIVATFGENGPLKCSGLPVMRYTAKALHAEFGGAFTLIKHETEAHRTPMGTEQEFVYCHCRKN
jgi:SAM-dependent methyltransferase